MAGKDNSGAEAVRVFREFSWTLAGMLAGGRQPPQPRSGPRERPGGRRGRR